ncbi:MAG: biopolymer transporter ExbD [bacterium]
MKPPSKAAGKHRIMADINMIPFIDVSLVLLLIFMIMTPLMVRSQLKINLPSTKDSQQDLTRKETIQVQVDRNGTAYLSGMPVAPDLLESRLRQLLMNPNQPVVVEADKDVPFQHVITVMDAAKRIGALKLAVCVKKQGKK